MYYYRARYYDPHSGRFLQEDPHPGELSSPVTVITKYSYGKNNPNKYVDPDGRWAIVIAVLISAVVQGGQYQNADLNFWDGFIQGAISASIVAAGAFTGSWVLASIVEGGAMAGLTATMVGGSWSTIVGGGIGGGLAGFGGASSMGANSSDAVVAGVFGMVAGMGAGAGGFRGAYGMADSVRDWSSNFAQSLSTTGTAAQGCFIDEETRGIYVTDQHGGICFGNTQVQRNR